MLAAVVLSLLIGNAPVDESTVMRPGVLQQADKAPDELKPEQPWPPAGVFRPGPDVTLPKLIKETRPNLVTARVSGTVVMGAVVLMDGSVGEVRLIRSVDKKHGLDEEAIKTVKEWRFIPGAKDGIAVPVVVEVKMTIVLR